MKPGVFAVKLNTYIGPEAKAPRAFSRCFSAVFRENFYRTPTICIIRTEVYKPAFIRDVVVSSQLA